MKRLIILTISALLACSGIAFAADEAVPKKGGNLPGMDQRLEMLKKQLDLKPEQETKVREMFQQEMKDMRQMRTEAQNLTPEQRREKMMENRKKLDGKMKDILTPEQYEKWEKGQQKRAAAFEKKGYPKDGPQKDGPPAKKKAKQQ